MSESTAAQSSSPSQSSSPATQTSDSPRPERPSSRVLLMRFGGAAVLVVMDLWSKWAVFAWLTPLEHTGELARSCACGHERMHVLGEGTNWFSFMLSRNPGAAFGGFSGYPHLLVMGRVAAVLFLVWMLIRTPRGRSWFTFALVLVLGGALGNLYDNLFLIDANTSHPYGEVRDFIDVYFARWTYHFPTFNVADSGITVGAVLLFLTSFAKDHDAKAAESVSAESVPADSGQPAAAADSAPETDLAPQAAPAAKASVAQPSETE